jgi:hypothetical protein
MRTPPQANPLRSLTWGLVALVAGIALLSGFVNVLQGAVQRGEWKAQHAQAGVWRPAAAQGSKAPGPDTGAGANAASMPAQDMAAMLRVLPR